MIVDKSVLALTKNQRRACRQQFINEITKDFSTDRRRSRVKAAEARKQWDRLLASYRKLPA